MSFQGTSIGILIAFIIVMNVLVYWGLLPSRSTLKYEDASVEDTSQASAIVSQTYDDMGGSAVSMDLNMSLTGSTSPNKGLKQKLITGTEDEDLRFSTLILGTVTGNYGSGNYQPMEGAARDSVLRPSMDVKDYEVRSVGIKRSLGIRLLFRNLEYSIGPSPDKMKKILMGVSGRINPGEMCALMGGSGAGKSTLLDVLAGRKTSGHIEGEIYFNGQQVRLEEREGDEHEDDDDDAAAADDDDDEGGEEEG
jgi:ABC-type multidrug transport system fused ATPase/permease subunit